MNFKTELQSITAFHRAHKAVASMIWILSLAIACVFIDSRHPAITVLSIFAFAVLFNVPVFSALIKYEAALKRRMQTADPISWNVRVNGVEFGSLTDARYAAIRHVVFFDPRTYARQLSILIGCLWQAISAFIWALPTLVFWAAIGCYFFAPTDFALMWAELQKLTPQQITASMPSVVQFMTMFTLIWLFVSVAVGKRFGFINRFEEAVTDAIRRAVNCPANGDVSMYRIVSGTTVSPSERDCILPEKVR